MSLVNKIYNEEIANEILLNYFHQNQVPSVGKLIDDINSLKETYSRLGQEPLTLTFKPSFSRYASIDAKEYNSFWKRIYKDISVLSRSVIEIVKQISLTEQNWNLFYSRISDYMDQLENRVDELLLLNQDTLGFFAYVADNFKSVSLTDLSKTTAEVSTSKEAVLIPPVVSSTARADRVNVDASQVNVKHNVSHNALVSSTLGSGVKGSDMVTDSNKPWYVVVATSKNKPSVVADIVVNLGSSYTFNNINLDLYGSTSKTSIVTAFYSNDGIDWIKASSEPTQSVNGTANWIFSEIEAKYLRFLFVRKTFDSIGANNNYIWTLGINRLWLQKNIYSSESTPASALFQSVNHSIVDFNSIAKPFNKVILDACEIIPPDTDIKYEVSANSGESWLPISNSRRSDVASASIVDFGDERVVHSIIETNRLVNSLNGNQFSTDLSLASIASDFGANDAFINLVIPSTDLSNLIYDSIRVNRNTGSKNESKIVRNIPGGWYKDTIDASLISTNFLVLNPDGVEIDVGPIGAIVDGAKATNSIFVEYGIHTFKTNTSNWSRVASSAASVSELEALDSLYPYNHKLLIEGYPLPEEIIENPYPGFSMYAGQLLEYLPIHSYNLINDIDLGVFTYTVKNNQLIFVLKVDSSFSDYANETFEISYRTRNNAYSSIMLKAYLSTSNASLTPVLKDYTLKVG